MSETDLSGAAAAARDAASGRLRRRLRCRRGIRQLGRRTAARGGRGLRGLGCDDARLEHALSPRHLESARSPVDATGRPCRHLPVDRGHLHSRSVCLALHGSLQHVVLGRGLGRGRGRDPGQALLVRFARSGSPPSWASRSAGSGSSRCRNSCEQPGRRPSRYSGRVASPTRWGQWSTPGASRTRYRPFRLPRDVPRADAGRARLPVRRDRVLRRPSRLNLRPAGSRRRLHRDAGDLGLLVHRHQSRDSFPCASKRRTKCRRWRR